MPRQPKPAPAPDPPRVLYRADNRPVDAPTWAEELASWLALVRG
jgi:hypothetical protein